MTTTEHQSEPGVGYDSRPDTLFHSLRVGELMVQMLQEAMARAVRHDLSKTQPPEVELFDRMTPKLKTMAYGSDEYTASLAALAPALNHHYATNRHHPEHFADGVSGMTLVDLLEMVADWKASTERMGGTGDLRRSVQINEKRFGMTPQLAQILVNTAEHFGWVDCGVTHTAPDGTRMRCNMPARPHNLHCDGRYEPYDWPNTEQTGPARRNP